MTRVESIAGAPGDGAQDGMSEESLWYKDAMNYHLHVKAFYDSGNEGI